MLKDELTAMEHGFWRAAGDGAYYAEHMHLNGRCLLPVGMMDKSSTVEAIAKAEPWSSHTFEDVEVDQPTRDIAVLTYAATGQREMGGSYQALISTTYIRSHGSWTLYLHQQTPLATGSGSNRL